MGEKKMFYVVAKVMIQDSELVVSDEVKVANDVINAVNRLGAWKGDVFAVWEEESRPNAQQAAGIAQSVLPTEIVMFSGGMLFRLDDDYSRRVCQSMRG